MLKTTLIFNYRVGASNLSTFNHGHNGTNILAESGDSKAKQYFAMEVQYQFQVINVTPTS